MDFLDHSDIRKNHNKISMPTRVILKSYEKQLWQTAAPDSHWIIWSWLDKWFLICTWRLWGLIFIFVRAQDSHNLGHLRNSQQRRNILRNMLEKAKTNKIGTKHIPTLQNNHPAKYRSNSSCIVILNWLEAQTHKI